MDQQSEGPTQAKRPNNGVTQEELNEDRKLVKWFCEDLGPYCILDYNGCRNYFKETIPNYTLPSKKKFLEELIPEQYKIVSSHLKKMLQSVDHVAITIDAWKYAIDRKRRNMWSGTVHFVHKGKFVSQILFTTEVKLQQKQKEDCLKQILNKWRLLPKIVCFVTGHEKNDNLLQLLNSLQKPYLFCVAATLSLTFQECYNYLTILKEPKDKITKEPESLKKKKDEPFGWHSQYTAIQNMSENATGEERTELVECVQILKPLANVADALSKTQYTTLSSIIPLSVNLRIRIDKCTPTTNRAKDFQKVLINSINSHFGHYSDDPLVKKATFIDPRFTKAAFMNNEVERTVEEEVIKELYGPDPGNPSTSPNHNDQPEATPSTSNNQPEEKHEPTNDAETENPFAFSDETVKAEMTNNETSMIVVKQIKIPKLLSSDDPFKFWEKHKSSFEYKQLFRMSQKYLCIPATAIPAESISGEFHWKNALENYNERRNLLDFEHINEILFLHSYYSGNYEQ